MDVGNQATNLVPATATARLNIRFNDRHTGAALEQWVRQVLSRHAEHFTLDVSVSGEAFLTPEGAETSRLAEAIASVTGMQPRFDTGGGTSDARFISRYCPVAEFGLVGETMHKADEQVPVAELQVLTEVYRAVIRMKPPTPLRHPFTNVLLGILLVARGRAEGLRQFGDTPQSVLAALAPLLAFLLVGVVLGLLGRNRQAVTDAIGVAVGLLGPLVLSFELARRWDRAAQWRRFATAFCWCQWAAPMVMAVVLVLMAILMAAGVSGTAAAGTAVAMLFAYGLWLNWFLARHALALTGWRAAAMVAMVNVATVMLILIPQVADYLLNGIPAA